MQNPAIAPEAQNSIDVDPWYDESYAGELMGNLGQERRPHVDEAKIAAKAQSRRDVLHYADTGDEEAYVSLIKSINPEITSADLATKIELFRELRRIRAGGSGRQKLS